MFSYKPDKSEVPIASAILTLNDEKNEPTPRDQTKILKISAISKYPFVTCDHPKLDFQEVLVGKTQTQEYVLSNNSPVPVKFKVERDSIDSEIDGFSIVPIRGEIPPGELFSLKVTYKPKVAGVMSSAKYRVWAKSGNKVNLSATGFGTGYDVDLSARSINFGEVTLGKKT